MKQLLIIFFTVVALVSCTKNNSTKSSNPGPNNLTLVDTVAKDSSGNVIFWVRANDANSYSFTFGDGDSSYIKSTTSSNSITHKYGATGIYKVKVVAMDSLGRTASDSLNVFVAVKTYEFSFYNTIWNDYTVPNNNSQGLYMLWIFKTDGTLLWYYNLLNNPFFAPYDTAGLPHSIGQYTKVGNQITVGGPVTNSFWGNVYVGTYDSIPNTSYPTPTYTFGGSDTYYQSGVANSGLSSSFYFTQTAQQ